MDAGTTGGNKNRHVDTVQPMDAVHKSACIKGNPLLSVQRHQILHLASKLKGHKLKS